METLVVSDQHRNQYYSGSKSQISDRFGSSPSKGFKEISCRTFQSGAGILPVPFALPAYESPSVTKNESCLYQSSPSDHSLSENHKHVQLRGKSTAIPINLALSDRAYNDEYCDSELWAGPAYSNSPLPSSLPIPKFFSVRPKRSISLDLPNSASGIKLHAFAKSAPASPTRELYSPASDFFLSTASATENLRRILHLDIADN
ncbi:flocculation FLO11-like protein [Tasmannia lanceolata]|uniref:flocculation FLO11-like protein n=1 Tax=Tasmannia lanceolata TaxID=3420 RepID=UPI0040636D07